MVPDISHEYCFVRSDWPGGYTAPTNFVYIPPGTFTMGFWSDQIHQVTISRGFYMGKYEVPQAKFLSVMGYVGSVYKPYHPVNVTFYEARSYCDVLTKKERAAGRIPPNWHYRLPTEAEWEYACRAGTTTPFHYGEALRSGMAAFWGRYEWPPCKNEVYWCLDSYACFNPDGVIFVEPVTVGSFKPNEWGLYDMHGNVWEWCSDAYDEVSTGPVTDPQGGQCLDDSCDRIIRGGSIESYAEFCMSGVRYWSRPDFFHQNWVGFRPVLAPVQVCGE